MSTAVLNYNLDLPEIEKNDDLFLSSEEIYNNYDKRVMYGKNGRKRVIENYDWKKNVQTMIAVLENNKDKKYIIQYLILYSIV